MNYTELENLPPTAYASPDNFLTPYDGDRNREYREKQYQTGLEYGAKCHHISISYKSVWGARMKNGEGVASYEGIGYHAGTADLLRGFLDSGCKIRVYRASNEFSGVFNVKGEELTKRWDE